MIEKRQTYLRKFPAVYKMLCRPGVQEYVEKYGRSVVVHTIQAVFEAERKRILACQEVLLDTLCSEILSPSYLETCVQKRLEQMCACHLRRVINATGVILHTNLGRSPLCKSAIEHVISISQGYCNLEYQIAEKRRGNRSLHLQSLLCLLSGAEAALIVNNNAAAVLLTLSTLAVGKEVILSRGEMIEIGGSFRIPEVMKLSGAILREVGTTNKTHPADYEQAICERSALILKVHTSNFRVVGFTASVSLEKLVEIGRKNHLPVIEDLGSGCFVNLADYGITGEPVVSEILKSGVDVVTMSGDKLTGGPQAGIVLGKSKYIEAMQKNPLYRAFRVDKMTLGALEATLMLLLNPKTAINEIPTLKMITMPLEKIALKAEILQAMLEKGVPKGINVSICDGFSEVGGGALPLTQLPTRLVTLKPIEGVINVTMIEEALRFSDPPVIARISEEQVILDPRTLTHEDISTIANGLSKKLQQIQSSNETTR